MIDVGKKHGAEIVLITKQDNGTIKIGGLISDKSVLDTITKYDDETALREALFDIGYKIKLFPEIRLNTCWLIGYVYK